MAEPSLRRPRTVVSGSGAFASERDRRRYTVLMTVLGVTAVAVAAAMLAWDNPLPYGTPGFWRIAELRATNLLVVAVVVICQASATVAFQSAATNRIITPSIMGFEALYVAISTAAVYVLGVAGVAALQGLPQFALTVAVMVGFALMLYGWLLTGRRGDMQVMLLVGIVLGGGLGSLSTFMQRLLTPSEFDVLTARLFGSVANADAAYLPLAIPLCLVGAAALWSRSRRLNLISLGREASTNLGLVHRREVMIILFLVSVLMATSTALVGPLTFLGFLVAMLSYQLAGTWDHRFVLPLACLLGFVVLGGAYVVLKHVFYAEGAVSIIIEVVGGSAFLYVILKKGAL
ncbi:iron chelate uptake ABC transporter family permease subunit [Marihabitans asiaticum]|uniref:Iron complex transport system permease protein n=1 Tax=Marihabitans asiaticum TaxID=415218 RepID=A0A560WDA9_9MICO|nr:iron chelate uptake ABC transporter family permease subunit [Marihabitans asiaticum]TWD15618.1 iron complex transport system permease protein [Marihabitans asiaticum]